MADKMKPGPRTPVRATTHADTRSNIPTAELESFAGPAGVRPAIVRYPRDPSLDPQLVWKGKGEQDAADLQVPAVPIYIGETIDPLALVEELRAESEGRRAEQQLGFFPPYTDLAFEEKVDRSQALTADGYTLGMKTAVSVPDDVFERAERLARRERRTRSDVYSAALREYVARHSPDEIADALDRVIAEVGEGTDSFVTAASRQTLESTEW